ncbi:hypothetical protein F4212_14425 [Candidatus Poribacteria bacterium]|nr:hypothetical protein [Candidatus Poribacteria bacterium]
MKRNPIVLTLIILSITSHICLASSASHTTMLTNFYLESNLGIREIANQTAVSTNPEIRLFNRKSPNEAFLYSLAIPGMGQLYAGAKHGYLYTAAEIGLFVTYFILRNNAVNTRDDYREVVRQNIIFIGPASFDKWDLVEDFEHATQYENWNHVYDSEVTRNRTGKWYWKDLDPSLKDEKDTEIEFDSKYRLEAFNLRQKANDTFQTARTMLGLVILNHIVSAVEARITTRRWNQRQETLSGFEIDVQTDVTSGSLKSALVLRKHF